MAFDPNVPSTNNIAQSDIAAIKENFNQLRSNEIGTTVANATAGMWFVNNASSEIVTMQRNKANNGWIYGTNFPVGTALIFRNVSVPSGWTQETTSEVHDRCLRVINTTAISTGGSRLVSATAVGDTEISTAQMPAHNHIMQYQYNEKDATAITPSTVVGYLYRMKTTDLTTNVTTHHTLLGWNGGFATSGGIPRYIRAGDATYLTVANDGTAGPHNHNLALAYVDVIIGIKN